MSTTEAFRRLRDSIRREAEARGVTAYLVGGTVRDFLRRRVPRDLDVAIEGDAVAFARAWAAREGGSLASASAFGTATVTVARKPRPVRVDFSSTRGETYRHPGALPDVFAAGIQADLARRDFTVNAMAIALTGPFSGAVLDPYGGREDLRRGIIRMLHPGSPHDDPTRAFRAVRFALRLDFRLAPETRRWIRDAGSAGADRAVSGDRLRRELFLLFDEQPPSVAVAALAALDLHRAIDAALAPTAAVRRRLQRLSRMTVGIPMETRRWAALFAWCLDVSPEERKRVGGRLAIEGERLTALLRAPDDRRRLVGLLTRHARPSEVGALSRSWPEEEVLAVASALSPDRRERFARARRRAASVRLGIGGEDLTRSGLAPGPAIGRALERTWRARVDGRIRRAEELDFAVREGLQ